MSLVHALGSLRQGLVMVCMGSVRGGLILLRGAREKDHAENGSYTLNDSCRILQIQTIGAI